jgi:hypothetical protein
MRLEAHKSAHGMNTTETLFVRNTMRLLNLSRITEEANTSTERE